MTVYRGIEVCDRARMRGGIGVEVVIDALWQACGIVSSNPWTVAALNPEGYAEWSHLHAKHPAFLAFAQEVSELISNLAYFGQPERMHTDRLENTAQKLVELARVAEDSKPVPG